MLQLMDWCTLVQHSHMIVRSQLQLRLYPCYTHSYKNNRLDFHMGHYSHRGNRVEPLMDLRSYNMDVHYCQQSIYTQLTDRAAGLVKIDMFVSVLLRSL